MNTPRQRPARAVLERIADDYRRRGYEVLVEPRGPDLPAFLADATPDLIVQRANEHVVIEVKESPQEVDAGRLDAMSRKVDGQPGWHVVLLATNPSRAIEPADVTSLDEAEVRKLIHEAEAGARLGMSASALMVSWAAAEGVLRLLIKRNGLRLDRDDTLTLLRRLISEGLIDDEEFQSLSRAYQLRSALAHGRRSQDDMAREAIETTDRLTRVSTSLLSELRRSA